MGEQWTDEALAAEGRALTAAVTGGVQPQSLRVRVGALDLHCLVWGAAGDPTAVLVHGNGGHAHWWDGLVPALVPGWRLVVPDFRGHGESAWADPPRYAMEDLAADLVGVMDQLAPGRVALVGHSMGGRVAAWVAARHGARLRGLALLDTRLGGISPEMAAQWRGRMVGKRHGRDYATRAEALAAFRFVPDEPVVPAALRADLAHHAVARSGPERWTFRFDRAVLSLDGDGAGDLSGLLARMACPVVVMNGEQSPIMDDVEAAAAAANRGCRVHRFPGAHHFLVAHPQLVGAALREFLDELD